jgi:hypothetical protein
MITVGNGPPPGIPAEDLKMLAEFEAKRAAKAPAGNGHDPNPAGPPPMPETAKITIGGEAIEVPELSWAAFKRIRPIMEAAGTSVDWVSDRDGTIKVLTIALEAARPELTEDAIQQRLSLREALALGSFLVELLRLSGINPTGEAPAAGDSGSATLTLTPSSPNSSAADAPPPTAGTKSSG